MWPIVEDEEDEVEACWLWWFVAVGVVGGVQTDWWFGPALFFCCCFRNSSSFSLAAWLALASEEDCCDDMVFDAKASSCSLVVAAVEGLDWLEGFVLTTTTGELPKISIVKLGPERGQTCTFELNTRFLLAHRTICCGRRGSFLADAGVSSQGRRGCGWLLSHQNVFLLSRCSSLLMHHDKSACTTLVLLTGTSSRFFCGGTGGVRIYGVLSRSECFWSRRLGTQFGRFWLVCGKWEKLKTRLHTFVQTKR